MGFRITVSPRARVPCATIALFGVATDLGPSVEWRRPAHTTPASPWGDSVFDSGHAHPEFGASESTPAAVEPSARARAAGAAAFDVYAGYVAAGFTRPDALVLTAAVLAAAIQAGH